MGLPKDSGFSLHSRWPCGAGNRITDVEGVRVGHVTLTGDDIRTGVTAVLPHTGDLFEDRVMAGAAVLNGFGKSIGLIQLQEMGTIETPIILTNTLSVGTAFSGLCRYMLERHPDIGVTSGTVNCLITECNDGYLNDIRGMHVEERHIAEAIAAADIDFEEGAVGGGTGMRCLGLKGGIGSASRVLEIDGTLYTIGALVMSNFGSAGNLVIGGVRCDTSLCAPDAADRDKGSIIIILATDIPLTDRELGRVSRRAAIALGRTGSYMGSGSGDIAIAFTTANRVPRLGDPRILNIRMLPDDALDPVFEASVEAVEESIVSSLYHAETMTGTMGHIALGLRDFLRLCDSDP